MSKPENHICDECDYSSETKTGLTTHIGTEHIHACNFCDYTYAGLYKFDNHTCRIKVLNPTSYWFYTKDWFERRKCVRVFDNIAKEEVVVIHSEDYVTNNA